MLANGPGLLKKKKKKKKNGGEESIVEEFVDKQDITSPQDLAQPQSPLFHISLDAADADP
jgi:hypothetical protein